VASIQNKADWSYLIAAEETHEELPATADNALWKDAPASAVALEGVYFRDGKRQPTTVKAVTVQAVYNDKGVAFRLAWDDTTEDTRPIADQFLVAFKPADFKGSVRENLSTAYLPNSSPFDLMLWSSANKGEVRQKVDNLDEATRASWNSTQAYPAQAVYNDGQWTLVFTRPLEKKEKSIPIGFAAWNGGNGEAAVRHSSSQWVTLLLGKPDSPHH
jgi:DMSO reductase family type II enzyme heme b subunit